ncbi:peptidoglycan DD-metalloendopeptidase family protein [uncultured Neptuniibacter sp.]|uniref:murein hydrolase activator EnvC family protein n=1 Tax=uncultured Neptuniibacter sp. TaxID=502143 RepID=UPI00261BB10D|nr:peptidoglycan DD-metalloendopeptidase family protein [uncultured Neptuniibacter sp.]
MLRSLFTFFLLLLSVSLSAADKQGMTEKQLKKLNSKISTLQSSMRNQEGESRALSQQLRKNEVKIGQLARQIQSLDKQLSGLGVHAKGLEGKRKKLKSELHKRAALIEKQIAQQYKMGNQARLRLLLTQRDPETLDRQIRYYDYVNQALQRDMRAYRQKLSELSGTERELTETEQTMVSKRDQLREEVSSLRRTQQQRADTLAKLKQTLSAGDNQLKQLRLDQERLKAILLEIEESLNFATLVKTDKSFRQLKGKLPWPLKGRVRQNFGTVTNNISYDGIWIQAKAAASVKAVHHGRVVFSDWLRGYGLVIIIDHGDGYMSLYGYNQSLLLETGDWVGRGDLIATAGNSGGRDQDGLYFAIRYKGKPSNPRRWLSR